MIESTSERLPGRPAPLDAATRLRTRLIQPELLIVPTPYDALSARLASEAGSEALFMGGYATAAARAAYPDIGLLTPAEMLEAARTLVQAADVPLLVDGDTGYGGRNERAANGA